MEKRLVGVKELSEMLSLPIGTIYNMVSRKELPIVKIGHRTRFNLTTIDSWIEEHSYQPKRSGGLKNRDWRTNG